MADTKGQVVKTTTGVGKGFGAGLALVFGQAVGGPILGTLIGALLAGWLVKEHRAIIAMIAGLMLAQGMMSAPASGQSQSSAVM